MPNKPFHRALARLAFLFFVLLPLAGCIYSGHDLADELAPEFALADGPYLDAKGAELRVEKADRLYRVTDPDDETYEIAFFRMRGYDGFVVRIDPERVGSSGHKDPTAFAYGFARQVGSAMEFYLIDEAEPLPPEVAALVQHKPNDDHGFSVRDEKDTLRVLGLVAKNAKLKLLMTLTPKP
jgi:hypothetical protein